MRSTPENIRTPMPKLGPSLPPKNAELIRANAAKQTATLYVEEQDAGAATQ